MQIAVEVAALRIPYGFAYTLNVQPVVPISISDDWNVISRTILPIAYRDYLPPPDGNSFGLGGITQSLFSHQGTQVRAASSGTSVRCF